MRVFAYIADPPERKLEKVNFAEMKILLTPLYTRQADHGTREILACRTRAKMTSRSTFHVCLEIIPTEKREIRFATTRILMAKFVTISI